MHLIHYFVPAGMHALFYITLSLMAGITVQFITIPFSIPFLVALLIFIFGLIYKEYYGFWQPLFFSLPSALLAGFLLCASQQSIQNDFQQLTAGKTTHIKGIIKSIEPIQNPRFKYRLIIDIDQWSTDTDMVWQKTTASIAIYTHCMNQLEVADSIQINQLVFKEITNHSFKNYLAKEKICATLFIDSLQCILLNRPYLSVNRTLFYYKENLFNALHSTINRETFQLFSSIFLGNRIAVKKQMEITKEPFKIWGTSHYLARSGLHLVLFVLVWHFILSLIPLSYLYKQFFLIFLILIYALLSWSSISFERALLMFLIYKLCLLTNKPSHYVHLVVLATFLVLCINPLQLFFLDFQLSFGITFALAWFNHISDNKKRAM
jgi:predicted membrane metal-binding protein